MNADASEITFPPGVISDEPLRIPMLWNSEAVLALAKPAGIAAFQDSRIGGGPRSILTAINKRAAEGASQFEQLGVVALSALNLLDREASGIVLYAKSHGARSALKNEMGSSRFSFRYRFVTVARPDVEELSIDLPLAVHREKSVALVSHRTGKKTSTLFRCLERWGDGSLWESESAYDRFHQVRLHAAEAGLPVSGDALYGNARRAAEVLATAGANFPSHEGLALHLFSVRFPLDEGWITLEAPYPKPLERFLKQRTR